MPDSQSRTRVAVVFGGGSGVHDARNGLGMSKVDSWDRLGVLIATALARPALRATAGVPGIGR